MKNAEIIRRVENLERELAELKRRMNEPRVNSEGLKVSSEGKTWKDYIGMFAGDKYFERAVKAGTAYRRSLRPKARARKGRHK